MSSGTYTSPGLSFNNTGAPATGTGAPCPAARFEPRGPAVYFTGLCHRCGRATTSRDPDGRPAHDQVPGLSWTHGGTGDPAGRP